MHCIFDISNGNFKSGASALHIFCYLPLKLNSATAEDFFELKTLHQQEQLKKTVNLPLTLFLYNAIIFSKKMRKVEMNTNTK